MSAPRATKLFGIPGSIALLAEAVGRAGVEGNADVMSTTSVLGWAAEVGSDVAFEDASVELSELKEAVLLEAVLLTVPIDVIVTVEVNEIGLGRGTKIVLVTVASAVLLPAWI